jgi:hypothetical protein
VAQKGEEAMSDPLLLKTFSGRLEGPPTDQAILTFQGQDGREIAVRFPRTQLTTVALALLELLGQLGEASRSGKRGRSQTEAVLKVKNWGASLSPDGTPVLGILPEKGPRLHFQVDKNQLEGLEEWFRQTRLSLQGQKGPLQ